MSNGRIRLRRVLIVFGVLFVASLGFVLWYKAATHLAPPQVKADPFSQNDVIQDEDSILHLANNFLLKNDLGLYEMYLEGDGYERGLAHGILCKDLILYQEGVFIKQLKQIIPNERYLSMLKYATLFFNRHMPEYIPTEYLEEIYGISKAHPDSFNFIGDKYDRVLNYHAAHDIGHTMQQYMLVGCTSFSAWDGYTKDSQIVVGRNFDFYMGDDFARNKVVSFFNPDSGYAFATVSWPGFIGAVSGMNLEGLAITINASAGSPPTSTKMPIAILVREILQKASNIDEALAICKKRETFVSESILVSSAKDRKTVIIEKSPTILGVFERNESRISCSNHYQSKAFENDEWNKDNIQNSDSPYRLARMNELMDQYPNMDVEDVAAILRSKEGLFGVDIGLGNQKSVNQLICHHAVIFKPEERKMWVSAPPYNLGAFACYDLKEIFALKSPKKGGLYRRDLLITSDPFLKTDAYAKYELFKKLKPYLVFYTQHPDFPQPAFKWIQLFEDCNPNWYHTHVMLGDYHVATKNLLQAKWHYKKALSLEIASVGEKESIIKKLNKLEKTK